MNEEEQDAESAAGLSETIPQTTGSSNLLTK